MSMKEKVEQALEKIRPSLQMDGGNIDLIDVDENEKVVKVKLTGACGSCPMAQMTLKNGVEEVIRQFVPDLKAVENVG